MSVVACRCARVVTLRTRVSWIIIEVWMCIKNGEGIYIYVVTRLVQLEKLLKFNFFRFIETLRELD